MEQKWLKGKNQLWGSFGVVLCLFLVNALLYVYETRVVNGSKIFSCGAICLLERSCSICRHLPVLLAAGLEQMPILTLK